MNMDMITLEDCLINYEVNAKRTILSDGQVIGFEEDHCLIDNTPYTIKFTCLTKAP